MRVPTVLRLLGAAARGWSRDNVPRLGASLAYYTLFSLAPILLVAIAIAGFFFGQAAVRGEIVEQVGGVIGPAGARAVEALLQGASQPRSGLVAGVIGVVSFFILSTGAFFELQHALNTIFRVRSTLRSGLRELLLDRVRSFGMVLSIGFLLLVSLVLSAGLSAVSAWVGQAPFLPAPYLLQAVDTVVSLGVITVLFGLIYRFLPDVRLEWRDVWIGAFFTALLFSAGKYLIGLYLGRSATASSYGAAGSVVVLLLWVYYASQIVLYGAELTRVWAEHRGRILVPSPFARIDPSTRPSEG